MPIYKNEDRLDSEESIAMNVRLLELMEKTSYRILQVNGQRRYGGPPPKWSGPPPPKDSEVFVGKIPRNCFEDELVPVFSKVGQIYELRLMMDFSGTNRGYAFVMYTCPEHADKAVSQLNNYEIRQGRYIGVVKSTNNCKIYIGTLSSNVDRKVIKKTIKYLTEGVVDVKVHVLPGARKRLNCSRKPHFVIVEYESHRAAAMARRRLLPARLELWGHEVSVEWANSIQKLSSNSRIQNQKLNGNKRRSVRNGQQQQKPQVELSAEDLKLIDGRTLEQVMDEMLYGSSESRYLENHSGSSKSSSFLGSGSMHSDSEISCTGVSYEPDFYNDFENYETASGLCNVCDDNFSKNSVKEGIQRNVKIGLISDEYLVNQHALKSTRGNCNHCLPVMKLDSDFIDKFTHMNVSNECQSFGCNREDNVRSEKNYSIHQQKIKNTGILEGNCQFCSYPLLNLMSNQQYFPSYPEAVLSATYPFFYSCAKGPIVSNCVAQSVSN